MAASPQSVLTFNGTSDYISVPDSSSLQISAYTVEAWIKPAGKPNEAWKGIVGKPGRNYNIWIHNTGYVHHRFHTKASTNSGVPNTAKSSIKWNKWSHVAITNDGKTAKTYINGQLKKQGPTGGALIVDKTPLYVARRLDQQSGNYFKGQIADIRVWDQVRSPDQIKNLMGQRLKGDEAGLVGYWPLNEGSGTTAKDLTGNGNQGTIHGGTWTQEELDFITPASPKEKTITETKQLLPVLTFDGKDDFIDCGSGINLTNTNFTIEFWAKRKRAGKWHIVAFQGELKNNHGLHIGFRSENLFTLAFFGNDLNTGKYTDSDWHHWSCVYDRDRNQQIVYRDGIEVKNRQAQATYQGTGSFYIGSLQGTELFFEGQLADLRIWKEVRTPQEIQDGMNSRLIGNESGLMAYWPFDESEGTTVKDKTGNGNDGKISGAVWQQEELDLITPASPTEQSPQSVPTFDGKDDYIEVPYKSELNPAQFTLSCWVKVAGGQGKWRSPVTSRHAKGRHEGYKLYAGTNNKWQFWTGDGKRWVTLIGSDVVLNTWTHVAATYDGSKMTLYINGEPVGTPVQSKINLNTTYPLRIGAGKTEGNPGFFFNGEITEVRLWNRVHSQDQIKQSMNQRLQGDEAGLVGYWPLNEGSGTTVADKTNHENSGTIHGATWKQEELDLSTSDSSQEETQAKELQPALTFDGKDDYISIALNEPETEVTHEFWFKTDSPNCGFFSVVIGNNWGYHDRHLYLSGGNIKTRIWSNEVISSSNLKLADNKWHHLAHVFGSSVGGQKIYIDGELVASGSKHTSDANKQDTIWIGYSVDAQKKYCQGQITDVRIWKIARSPEEIKQSMNHRLRGDEEGLLGYWPLNEGSGAIATDKTSNGNQGTIYGAGTWKKEGGGTWKQEEIDFLQPAPPKEQSPETSSEGESEESQKPEEAGELLKLGPKGSSIKGTSFDIYPKEVAQSKITSISVGHAWAIDNLQVTYKSPDSSSVLRCKESPNQSGEEFSLEAGDYLTKISGSWGRQAPDYPKEEIITLQFHTHKGVSSKVFGGGSGKQQVEPFTLEAPEGQEIIGFFGSHGGRQDILTSLGIYLKPVEEIAPAPEEPTEPDSNLSTAITFDGKKDYVDIPPDSALDLTDDFTIEAWIKPEILGKRIVDKGIGGKAEGFTFDTYPQNLRFINKGVKFTSRNQLKTKIWQHVAVTFKNEVDGVKLYINGEEENTATPNKVGTVTKLPVRIASQADKLGNLFKGDIAEVRMWNRVRSQDELKQSMNHRLRGDEAGLVGYWPLNEGSGTTIADKTSNDNPGTLHGGTWQEDALDFIQPAPPKQETTDSQSALMFDGVDDYVSLPISSIPEGKAITISFWAKGGASLPKQNSVFFANANPDFDPGKGRIVNIHLPWSDSTIYFDCGSDGKTYNRISKAAKATDFKDKWTHWAFTLDANTGKMAIYLNGELWCEGNKKTLSIPKPAEVKLGSGYGFYHGSLSDVRVWDKALTPTEVKETMSVRLTGKEPGLVSYWPLDEGIGTTLTDLTSNGNHGTIHGATWEEDELEFITPASPEEQATTDSEQATTDSEQATTDSEQATTDSEQTTTDSEQATTDSEQTTTDSEQTTTDSEQTTTDSEQATTDSEQATTDSEQATTDEEKLPSVLTFDGKDDCIDCGSGINLTNTSFTIEFWAKRKIAGKFDLIVSQGEQKKNHCLHIGFRDSDLFTFAFWGDDLNTGKFTDTDWHHWSCVYDVDRQQQIIYRDGQLEACRQPANYKGTGNFYIGSFKGTSHFFEGQLADLRIWEEVRTPQEIQDGMNSRLTGNESGLMAYWPLDEGEGTTITDKTGNGNDGTITGAIWEQMEIPFEDAEPSSKGNIVITLNGEQEYIEIPSDSTLDLLDKLIIRFQWGAARIKKNSIKIKMKTSKSKKKPSRKRKPRKNPFL